MHSIDYLEIIRKALTITWRHKFLWWFGLMTALVGAGNSFNYSFDRGDNFTGQAGQQMSAFFTRHPALIFSGVALLILLFFVFLIIGLIGRGALIKSIEKVAASELYDFKMGFFEGKKYFWKLLWLVLALALLIIAAFIILAIPITFLFINKNYVLAILLLSLAFLIIIPLIILAVYLRVYGYLYVVLGELRVRPALENAYALLRKNLGASLLMGLIFILIGISYALAVLLLFVPVIAALFLLGSFLYLLLKTIGIIVAVALGIVLALSITLFLKSIYETFAQTVWILFFHEIAKSKAEEPVAEPAEELKAAPRPDAVQGSDIS